MADDNEGSGTTLIIVFIILLLCGCGAFYFFYYRYTTGWTTISDVSVDPSLNKPDATEISLYKAQKTAYDNNNLAFFIVSNGASTYDVYYYPPGKNAPKPASGKATLYYKNAPTSSSDESSSATSTGGSSSATSTGGSSSATSTGGSSSATSTGGSSSATRTGGSSSATSTGGSSSATRTGGSSSATSTGGSSATFTGENAGSEIPLKPPPWTEMEGSVFRNRFSKRCKVVTEPYSDQLVYDYLNTNTCPPAKNPTVSLWSPTERTNYKNMVINNICTSSGITVPIDALSSKSDQQIYNMLTDSKCNIEEYAGYCQSRSDIRVYDTYSGSYEPYSDGWCQNIDNQYECRDNRRELYSVQGEADGQEYNTCEWKSLLTTYKPSTDLTPRLNDITTPRDIHNAKDCIKLCKNTSGCQAAVFHKFNNSCHMKSVKGPLTNPVIDIDTFIM
jgi:hypothetical protein